MSHYAVAVIHHPDQDIDEMLAPFNENIRVPKYIAYTRAEAIAYAKEHYKSCIGKTDDECYECFASDYDNDMRDTDGNLYSTYNPDSKWDWYTEGGRWGGMLRDIETGESVDEGEIGKLDFSMDEEAYKRALRFWDVVVDHRPQDDDEDIFPIYKEEYYKEYYGTKEDYAKSVASFSTYAVLTPDGVWHAPGNMGWFGCSSESADESKRWHENYMKRFIDSADTQDIITIVDCHI